MEKVIFNTHMALDMFSIQRISSYCRGINDTERQSDQIKANSKTVVDKWWDGHFVGHRQNNPNTEMVVAFNPSYVHNSGSCVCTMSDLSDEKWLIGSRVIWLCFSCQKTCKPYIFIFSGSWTTKWLLWQQSSVHDWHSPARQCEWEKKTGKFGWPQTRPAWRVHIFL